MKHNYPDIDFFKDPHQLVLDDKEFFEQLYELYASRLQRYIKPFVKNSKPDCEEVLQEVFLKVWVHRKKVANADNVQAYLFRMARNELINRHARESSYKEAIDRNKPVIVDTETSLERMIYSEYVDLAEQVINQLSPQRKTIFKMRTEEEMSISEIASELNITSSAVKKQLYEARDFVKDQLSHKAGFPLSLIFIFIFF